MRQQNSNTTTQGVYLQMLENIQRGAWPVGSSIPSERELIDQFGVSRIAIREAVSMLRGIGIVDVSHGRRTRVRQIDAQVLDQLLPMMLATGGQQTFQQIFDVRLALESQAAFIAATTRTDQQMKRIEMLAARFERQSRSLTSAASLKTDFEFHFEIAKATNNPLFSILLEALMRFVVFGQLESCKNDPQRRQKAVEAHAAIAAALAAKDPDRARAEMEAHLRYSASRVIDAMGDFSQG